MTSVILHCNIHVALISTGQSCSCVFNSGTSAGGVQQSTGAPARQGLHQDASRHRYRFAPPATPEGLWDMGFGDSQDSRM